MGVRLYIVPVAAGVPWSVAYTNFTVYISTTTVWRNGTVCVSSFTPTAFAPSPNNISCPGVTDVMFVTLERPITSVSGALQIYELQVLRAGETWR